MQEVTGQARGLSPEGAAPRPAERRSRLVVPSAAEIAPVILFGSVLLSQFYEVVPALRHTMYLSLPLLALLYLGSVSDPRRPVVFVPPYTVPFLVLLTGYVVLLPRINVVGVKDALFIACYLAYFVLFAARRINVALLNAALIGVYAIHVLWRDELKSWSLLTSTAGAESPLSLVFGLFAVYALVQRKHFWFVVNLAALVFSLKRVALLGVSVAILFVLLPRSLRERLLNPVVACIANLAAVAALLAIGYGAFDDWVADTFGIPAATLTMGRATIYAELARVFDSDPLRISLVGIGPGRGFDILSGALGGIFDHLHSGVLKISFELGVPVFIAFCYTLYAARSWRVRLLALYLNVILLTDNVLVYVDFMAFYLLLASQLALADADRDARAAAAGPAPPG